MSTKITKRHPVCDECGVDRRFRDHLHRHYEEMLYKQMYRQKQREERLMLRTAESKATTRSLYKNIDVLRAKIADLEETVHALTE